MVQIYNNPNEQAAYQVALQNNPNFAAFNGAMAGMSDAPITGALHNLNQQEQNQQQLRNLGMYLQQQQDAKKLRQEQYARQDETYLRGLREGLANIGVDPSKANNIDTALTLLSRNREQPGVPLPQYNAGNVQTGSYSVPNMSQVGGNSALNDAYLSAITGIDTTADEQALSKLVQQYRNNPTIDRSVMENAMNNLNYKKQERLAKSKRINDQKQLQNDTKFETHAPLMNWIRSIGSDKLSQRRYNETLLAKPWARLTDPKYKDYLTEDIGAAARLSDQQNFVKEVYNDLAAKGYREVDKQVVDRLMAQTPFNYNPDTQIVVTNGAGQLALYDVTEGKVEPIM